MKLKLYDTYTRRLCAFEPLRENYVRIYACGLTVYDYAHIGNLRTYVFEDVLRRVLEFNAYTVQHVMNITDVGHLVSDADTGEDKMELSSRRSGKSSWELAEFYTQAFRNDLQDLNILEPDIWCKATEHIREQIELVECIEMKGFTYKTTDGIYFDTSKLPDYGSFARLDIEGLKAGSRIEIGGKRNPADFVLWKFSPTDQQRQMEWDSPWGVGFPGWHIECSAMAVKYLGEFFDIHCGGEDHIPVHHTNEIAQAEACYGTRLANFWMHGYFLIMGDTKMSKSSGRFLRLQDIIDRGYDPLAYRFCCLGAHYRAKLKFSWDSLTSASSAFDRLRRNFLELGEPGTVDNGFVDKFTSCINQDLNTPKALALCWELIRSNLSDPIKKATLTLFDNVLGLRLDEWQPEDGPIPDVILELVERRDEARSKKRWDDADEIREQIYSAGFEIEDTPNGPQVKSKKKTNF